MPSLGYIGAAGQGFTQGYPQGYEQSLDQASQVALGNTLRMLQGGQQQPPMQPIGPPGGGQQPPMMPPPQQAAGPQPIGQGSPPMSLAPGGAGGGAPPPPRPGSPPVAQPGQPMPPPQQQPPMQQPPQPQGWDQGGGGFDVRQIIMAIARANPGVPPQVLAKATDQAIRTFVPVQLREQALQQAAMLGLARIGATERGQDIRAETAEGAQATVRRGQDIRAETAAQNRFSREEIARMSDETKRELVAEGILSRQEIAEAQIGERRSEAEQRTAVQEKGIETRAATAQRGQDIRAETAAQAEAGRMKRAELSADTKREMTKLSLETRREIAAAAEAGKDYRTSYQEGARTQRTQLSNEARKEIAGMSVEARKELTQYLEGGRMERSEQARTSREETAAAGRQSRESIAAAGREERGKEAGARLDVQKSALQARIEAINTQRQIYGLPPVGKEQAQEISTHSPAVTGADRIADQIVQGKRPPGTTGLGMHGGFQVSQSLATRYPEFDQTQATLEYDAAKRTVMGMTSPQQVRFQQLGKAVVNTFDKVIEDARKMKLSGITPLNKADIDYLVNTRGNTPAGKLAATYLQDVAFLKGEVANLENGGYAPTESSWAQAKQVINENYGVDEMIATAHNAQRLINFRLHALTELPGGTLGVGSGAANRYLTPGAPSPHEQRQKGEDLGGGWTYHGTQ